MDRQQAKAFVEQWKRVAPLLEQQRERDIRASDTARDIRAFDRLVEDALRRFPPRPDSGLVEMQKHFMRFTKKMRPEGKPSP